MDEEEIIKATDHVIGGPLQRTGLQDKVKSYWPTRQTYTFIYIGALHEVCASANTCFNV